jgi:hypothetical protein
VSSCLVVKCGPTDLLILVRSLRPILGMSSLRSDILCCLSDLAFLDGSLSDLIIDVGCAASVKFALLVKFFCADVWTSDS